MTVKSKHDANQLYTMKKTIVFLFLLVSTLTSQAQTMRELWINMPDSLTVFLNRGLRTELADYVDMKVTAEVNNLLKEKTVIDTMTVDYMHVKLTAASELELKLLPRKGGDIMVCMVRTYHGPAAQSTMTCYDLEWNLIAGTFVRPLMMADFIQKPKTMTEERYRDLMAMADIQLTAFHLSPDNQTLDVKFTIPQLTREDQADFDALLTQTKLKWDGEVFK